MAITPSDARLWRLISKGYFPSELPPPFQTEEFALHSREFAGKWDETKIQKFWTRPEHFSIPRYGHARRRLSIVNPVNQLYVSSLIARNWFAIRKRLRRTTVSEFDPRITIKGKGRAVTGVDFDGVARRSAQILATYGRYVKTDIARFYPSIYTHSIAWALLGKAHVKSNFNKSTFKKSFANKLDAAIRSGQEGQTIGIPIGPDTSRIISEIVAVEIESSLNVEIPNWVKRSVRYVDDMIIGIEEKQSEAEVLSKLSLALYDYELELNASKTKVVGLGNRHSPEWIHYLRNFELSGKLPSQRDDLDSYFEHSIYLADENPQENVLLFACKRAGSFSIDASNAGHLVRWLLYCCRRAPSCLRAVAENLAANPPKDKEVQAEIVEFILQQIPAKAEAGHTEELSWLLFWAREVSASVPDVVANSCSHLRSSTVALVALDLKDRGLISGILDDSFWHGFCNSDGLASEMWLVAYEATRRKWWSKPTSSAFIKGHSFFGDILAKDISFYDRHRKAKARRSQPFQIQKGVRYLPGTFSLLDG